MTPELFSEFVEKVRLRLEYVSQTTPEVIAACRSGEDFEVCVRDAVAAVLAEMGITATIHYEQGSHVFPDIVVEFASGEKYGIEVKSSTSTGRGWKINGNSVLGSTKEDVVDTYVMFGKTTRGHQAFRCKRYEDCVADVAVTHSPRYRIDMDLAPGTTFFDKSGLSYQQISDAEKPIDLITDYFRSQGQHAWWLSESSPAAIRMFSDLPREEQQKLLGYCFAHFPEVFSNKTNKFSRCAMWLAAEHSIVSSSLRDNFSAGGRVTMTFGERTIERVPRIFDTLRSCKRYVVAALMEASAEDLQNDWEYDHPINRDKVMAWTSAAQMQCQFPDLDACQLGLLFCNIMHP